VFAIIIHLGIGPIWDLPTYQMIDKFDFAYAVFFAALATGLGWGFIYCTKFLKYAFDKMLLPIYIKTFIGGVLLGIIAWYLPITRYFGHHEINELLNQTISLPVLTAILICKIVAIAITVTSGWRGG